MKTVDRLPLGGRDAFAAPGLRGDDLDPTTDFAAGYGDGFGIPQRDTRGQTQSERSDFEIMKLSRSAADEVQHLGDRTPRGELRRRHGLSGGVFRKHSVVNR
ncbi:MAG: hypothetical protein ABIZ04_08660 [Opitutus sp.]